MSTMTVSLPEALKDYVEQQVEARGFGTSDEYVRELIRRDRDRQRLRSALLEGAASAPGAPADDGWFEGLRRKAGEPTTG